MARNPESEWVADDRAGLRLQRLFVAAHFGLVQPQEPLVTSLATIAFLVCDFLALAIIGSAAKKLFRPRVWFAVMIYVAIGYLLTILTVLLDNNQNDLTYLIKIAIYMAFLWPIPVAMSLFTWLFCIWLGRTCL